MRRTLETALLAALLAAVAALLLACGGGGCGDNCPPEQHTPGVDCVAHPEQCK